MQAFFTLIIIIIMICLPRTVGEEQLQWKINVPLMMHTHIIHVHRGGRGGGGVAPSQFFGGQF
jgi:hypothetical protein